MIILLCWCCYALLNRVSTSCLNVVNTAKIFLSNNFQCLFHFGACLPFAKKINHLVYDVDHIVEDVVMINDSVNCLFAVWILLRLFAGWMMFYKVKRLFAKWLNVVEIVRCDLPFAKELLRLFVYDVVENIISCKLFAKWKERCFTK